MCGKVTMERKRSNKDDPAYKYIVLTMLVKWTRGENGVGGMKITNDEREISKATEEAAQ